MRELSRQIVATNRKESWRKSQGFNRIPGAMIQPHYMKYDKNEVCGFLPEEKILKKEIIILIIITKILHSIVEEFSRRTTWL